VCSSDLAHNKPFLFPKATAAADEE